jgi:hypothetical protein
MSFVKYETRERPENYFVSGGNAVSIRGTFPDSALLSEIFVL